MSVFVGTLAESKIKILYKQREKKKRRRTRSEKKELEELFEALLSLKLIFFLFLLNWCEISQLVVKPVDTIAYSAFSKLGRNNNLSGKHEDRIEKNRHQYSFDFSSEMRKRGRIDVVYKCNKYIRLKYVFFV